VKAVLVTGATTPFGRALCAALLRGDAGRRVVGVGLETPGVGLALPAHRHFTYLRADLSRSREIHDLLFGPARELGVETIVHGSLHRRADGDGRHVHELEVESTRGLLGYAEGHPTIRRFVLRSSADVYRVQYDQPVLIGEDHPLVLSRRMPQRLRDRVEADVTVVMRMGLSPLRIAVLRFAEILAPSSGSQLFDYLSSRVCLRPLGFDPMLQLLTIEDAVRASVLAVSSDAQGVFNAPGKDVLPLSRAIERAGRVGVAVPGPLLAPLYRLRARTQGTDFRYELNRWRFHFSGVLDGRRAREVLGYEPRTGVDWQSAPWRTGAAAAAAS
jgi:UDP-glucose 4-epimerase